MTCVSFCSKILVIPLRTQGIEQEIVDLLQGRLPRSVFVRHILDLILEKKAIE
ncbi:MAG: hypothetical protein WB443_10545 [Nitrososphaeraceae archaeon]